MSRAKMAVVAALLGVGATAAMAYPINIGLKQSGPIFLADNSTLLPAGAYVQVWWTADQSYGVNPLTGNSTSIDPVDAVLGQSSVPGATGDYVLWSGNTDADGGFANPPTIGQRSDLDVPPNTPISSGFVYIYVYQDGSPATGDSYIRSPLYGPPNPTWGNPNDPQPPPTDLLDIVPSVDGTSMGSFFVAVPEPGTMALFGLGMLTVAIRRRQKK